MGTEEDVFAAQAEHWSHIDVGEGIVVEVGVRKKARKILEADEERRKSCPQLNNRARGLLANCSASLFVQS